MIDINPETNQEVLDEIKTMLARSGYSDTEVTEVSLVPESLKAQYYRAVRGKGGNDGGYRNTKYGKGSRSGHYGKSNYNDRNRGDDDYRGGGGGHYKPSFMKGGYNNRR